MPHPFVSIIVPTLNSSKVLRNALDSVLNQKYKDYDIWVIDAVSTDETISILNHYQEQSGKIHFISERDNGIYDAMNKGAKLAKGQWLYFLGSDDKLYDQHVLTRFFETAKGGKYDMVYGDVFKVETNEIYGGRFSFHRLISKNICHQAIFLKRSVFEKYGPFKIEYKALADHDLNLRLFKKRVRTKYIKELIAVFGADGYSSTYYDTVFVKKFEEIYAEYKSGFLNRLRLKLDIIFNNYRKVR